MKTLLLPLIAALALVLPVSAQTIQHESTTTTTIQTTGRHEGTHRGNDRGGHNGRHDNDRGGHSHFRGDHDHFRHGSFYGEIIVLDDGCWFWNGFQWVEYLDCD